MPAKNGRPSMLPQVIRLRDDGSPVTAGEQVIEKRRLGLDDQAACDSAGVSRTTLHNWRLGGARARTIAAQGKRALTPEEQNLATFVEQLDRAEADWESDRLAIIQGAAKGGFVTTKTAEKWVACDISDDTPDGRKLVERTVTTETLHPQWQAAAWQLERMRRDKYARRWEVTGADGKALIPEADQARNLADNLRDYLQGVEDGAKARKGKPTT